MSEPMTFFEKSRRERYIVCDDAVQAVGRIRALHVFRARRPKRSAFRFPSLTTFAKNDYQSFSSRKNQLNSRMLYFTKAKGQ